MSGDDFCDGRVEVKWEILVFRCLIVGGWWWNSVRYALKRGRSVSIAYEILRTGYESTGENFQNRGTFMVVRVSVFSKCSAQKVHLARDAYYACWDSAGRRQERNFAPEN